MLGLADCAVSVHHIGESLTPLLVVDHFHPHPSALIEAANSQTFSALQGDFYPGLRAPFPAHYLDYIQQTLPQLLQHVGRANAPVSLSLNQFSITTTPQDKLKPIQCIPHIDTTADNEWAMVHYLFHHANDGTAFYRHRATALERVHQHNYAQYMQCLKTQATTEGLPQKAYIQNTTSLFEQIGQVEGVFNRAIFYPANVFHSGRINVSNGLSESPAQGRLTANACIQW